MKIAIVGKGGSGKSTISWLLANYFATTHRVLAIDEDFNMDLIDHFGLEAKDFDTISDNHQLFKNLFAMERSEKWFDLIKKNLPSYNLSNSVFRQLSKPVSSTLSLILTGLGNEENLYTGKCGHSHSAPLKFLLPKLLTKPEEMVIIDSVAGVDMLGYGLFMGVDLIVCSVEPAKNSIKVATQIQEYCKKLNLPMKFVINKYQKNQIVDDFINVQSEKILGYIPTNPLICEYEFDSIFQTLKVNLEEIAINLDKIDVFSVNQWKRLVDFEMQKDSIKHYLHIK